jgi:hypothetical protein
MTVAPPPGGVEKRHTTQIPYADSHREMGDRGPKRALARKAPPVAYILANLKLDALQDPGDGNHEHAHLAHDPIPPNLKSQTIFPPSGNI